MTVLNYSIDLCVSILFSQILPFIQETFWKEHVYVCHVVSKQRK